MVQAQWIKVSTGLFDDEKIQMIEQLPGGGNHVLVWIKLLCLAGKINIEGELRQHDIIYNDTMLATLFRMKPAQITKALALFEEYGMIFRDADGLIYLTNWKKHQDLEKLERVRTQNRLRKQKERSKNKEISNETVPQDAYTQAVSEHRKTRLVTQSVPQCHAAEKEKEKETDIEKEGEKEKKKVGSVL